MTSLLTEDEWQVFFTRLEGPEGCNFKEGTLGDPSTITWRCKGGMDQTYATAILNDMGLAEEMVTAVLYYCTSLGGHCDCEILFNAEERIQEDMKGE